METGQPLQSNMDQYLDVYRRVEQALELIRPGIQMDGGNIELVDVEWPAAKVVIQLTGACVGCASSAVTLKMGVEECIRSEVPEIKEVVAI